MSNDIVARLRSYAYLEDTVYNQWVYREAADEIERLKNQISHIIEHNNPQIEQANSYFKLLEEELARCNKIIDGYEEEHSKLRERRDDWLAAMTENHDLWRENERLRKVIDALEGEIRETAEASHD